MIGMWYCAVISSAAAIPSFSPWILMSIRIRSGRASPAIFMASSAVETVPTTAYPISWRASSIVIATMVSSSTIRIRLSGIVLTRSCALLDRCGCSRYLREPHQERRALVRPDCHISLELIPYQPRDQLEPKAFGLGNIHTRWQTCSIIADHEREHRAGFMVKADPDPPVGASHKRMLEGIYHQFVDDEAGRDGHIYIQGHILHVEIQIDMGFVVIRHHKGIGQVGDMPSCVDICQVI